MGFIVSIVHLPLYNNYNTIQAIGNGLLPPVECSAILFLSNKMQRGRDRGRFPLVFLSGTALNCGCRKDGG